MPREGFSRAKDRPPRGAAVLFVLIALLVAGVAGGEVTPPVCITDGFGNSNCTIDFFTGLLTWTDPPDPDAQFDALEKRIRALEERARARDAHGTREMKCVEGDVLMCDGPGCWCAYGGWRVEEEPIR